MSTRTITWADLGSGAWKETHSGTGPYRTILKGRELSTDELTSHIYQDATAYADGPPDIEVLDTYAGDVSIGETYPPYPALKWRGRTTASHYKIYRHNGSIYALVGVVLETGRGYYRWTDSAVNSPTSRTYKITTVDSEGNESDGQIIPVLVAGVPGRATQSYAYNAGTGNTTATVGI